MRVKIQKKYHNPHSQTRRYQYYTICRNNGLSIFKFMANAQENNVTNVVMFCQYETKNFGTTLVYPHDSEVLSPRPSHYRSSELPYNTVILSSVHSL